MIRVVYNKLILKTRPQFPQLPVSFFRKQFPEEEITIPEYSAESNFTEYKWINLDFVYILPSTNSYIPLQN